MTDLGTLGGTGAEADGINNRGKGSGGATPAPRITPRSGRQRLTLAGKSDQWVRFTHRVAQWVSLMSSRWRPAPGAAVFISEHDKVRHL